VGGNSERQSLRITGRGDRGGPRALQAARSPELFPRNFYDRALVDILVKAKGHNQVEALVTPGAFAPTLDGRRRPRRVRRGRGCAGSIALPQVRSGCRAPRFRDGSDAGASPLTACAPLRAPPCEKEDCVVVRTAPPAATDAKPEQGVRFDVLYTDDDIVVVDKPPGLVVHPSRGHLGGTLVNGLLALGLFRREDFAGELDSQENVRPGVVHRLDKGTSGVMVVARNVEARERLKLQFQEQLDRPSLRSRLSSARRSPRTFSTLQWAAPRRPDSGSRRACGAANEPSPTLP